MKKRIIPLLLCFALALSVLVALPDQANAATAQETGNAILTEALAMTFPTDGSDYPAKCPHCKTDVTWTALPTTISAYVSASGHYYLQGNTKCTIYQTFGGLATGAKICLHMNGKDLDAGTSRGGIVPSGRTLTIMGNGTFSSPAKSAQRGTIFVNNGTVNIYGTTITTTANNGEPVLSLYNTGATVNAWGATLNAGTNPAITTNGKVNLYNCTTIGGTAVEQDDTAGGNGSTAVINLVDSNLPGFKSEIGTVTVSGKAVINGTGLELTAGETIDPTNLTEGASIAIGSTGAFTSTGMADYAQYFSAVASENEIIVSGNGALYCCKPEAMLVAADGKETQPDDILTEWATGNYAYIKLYGDDTFAMEGQDILIDLNGFDLTVTGTGNIQAFDTANDGYDKNACGTILNNGTVTFTEAVAAPNGNRYVTVKESNRATAHRLDIKLTSISLRTTAAGLYYKAKYTCDAILAAKVRAYGVIVSVNNMPGANYANDGDDINKYTAAAAPFQSGITATSGSIFGIMKDVNDAKTNDAYAKIPIYANAYIDLGNGPIVADIVNPGKTVDDAAFNGTALSLHDLMFKLDDAYNNYNTTVRMQLDNFYFQWKEKGMDWDFAYIGQTAGTTDAVDNSDIELKFDEGTTDAMCPVCKEKVTWTALTVQETHQNLKGHYYLAEDIVSDNTGDAYVFNSTKNTTLCIHLNGHNLTATKTRVVHGSSGRTNIMGNGIVTGYQKTGDYGAAVMINNTVTTQSVHLYGGTYKKTANSHANATPLCINSAGGTMVLYEGVTVENSSGTAILVKTPGANAQKQELGLRGCTVNGNVKLLGGAPAVSKVTACVELVDCTINGNVDIAQYNDVYLAGAPVITSITRHEDVLLNTKVLTKGASIGIATTGIFTAQSESVKNYTTYFHGTETVNEITVRDNALHCGPDYTGDLEFEAGTTNAMCPVCAKVVTWTPVDGSALVDNSTTRVQQHYYLTNDVTYTAENGESSFLSPGHGSYSVCFHLNGHDFTGTNTRFVYGGTSVTNVMGSGTVSGARGDTYTYGSTVQANVANISGQVNLYGGTWTQLETGTYTASDYVISMSDNGGTINVYEDATVVANSNGKAIYLGTCNRRDTIAGIYGTVKGDIYAAGANQTKGTVSYITVDNGTVEGTMDINGVNSVTIGHAAKIGLLDMEATSLVTLDTMKVGANITVANAGVFTVPHESAAAWVDYFHAANTNDWIVEKENALYYKTNYTSKVYPDAEGKAYCPVCKETVEWTAVSSGESRLVAEAGKHYYLTADILYEEAYDSTTDVVSFLSGGTFKNASACFHLNGHNITATKTHGIYGGYGVLNVMGEGVVTGYSKGTTQNAAAQINNSVAGNALNLYGGTYRKSSDSGAATAVVGIQTVGSTLRIYEDVDIASSGTAMHIGTSTYRDSNVEIYGAVIEGDMIVAAPAKTKGDYKAVLTLKDTTVTGAVSFAAGNELTFTGRTEIGKLTIPAGQLVTFENMLEGSAVKVSADGVFTPYMELADEWLQYITCADEGDWIIVRDKTFYQEAKQEITAATDEDKTDLDTAYAGTTLRYGEMHNHTNSGPFRDDGTGTSYNTGADGQNSLSQWIDEMDRLKLDFAFIVDHGQSIHMYEENFPLWKDNYFIGGTEPATTITDSKAAQKSPHYNMLFSDPADLEAIFFKWEDKFKPVQWNSENYPDANNPYEFGYRIKYADFTTAQFGQLAQDVYAQGGLLVQVHPKYDSYIYSDDPLDYYFADYTGLEIVTGSGGNMMYKDNNEAYELWVDLLELGKKVFATAGSDKHKLPDYSGLTAIYTVNDHRDDYMAAVHAGNMAPGWIGIRMNVNGTAMGGETSFDGQRLQFSVGNIYNAPAVDHMKTPNPYVAGHTYRVELYDDGGILMSSTIDPTELNYFAVDCDATAKFYRIVVWDETDNERIGVSNPIWNTTAAAE